METVTDEEIVEGMTLLAQTEGIFAETAGGVTVGVLKKLVKQGLIKRGEVTVALITGNGLKTQDAVMNAVGRPTRSAVKGYPAAGTSSDSGPSYEPTKVTIAPCRPRSASAIARAG